MKKILLIIFSLSLFLPVTAQEFMTKREVYDFEIGDEFHFSVYDFNSWWEYSVDKVIIIDKYYSTNQDSLFYVSYHEICGEQRFPLDTVYKVEAYFSTVYYTELDSSITTNNDTYVDHYIENTPELCDSLLNGFVYLDQIWQTTNEYGKGLGLTKYIKQEPSWIWKKNILKYYKKGESECGTPPQWHSLMTIGEIFDFEIGDEFQSRSSTHNDPCPQIDRLKITDKFYSTLLDTLFYVQYHNSYKNEINPVSLDTVADFWTKTDTAFYTNLNSSLASYDLMFQNRFSIKHPSKYCESLVNSSSDYRYKEYGKGLGNVFDSIQKNYNDDYIMKRSFYFKKGANECGTPDTMASDLLTVQEVFDFNIGDKFQYTGTATHEPPNADRITIMDKFYSDDEDTLCYVRYHDSYYCDIIIVEGKPQFKYHYWTKTDTVFYTNLNSAISTFDQSFEFGHYSVNSSALCGALINGSNYNPVPEFENDIIDKEYGKGLGLILNYFYSGQGQIVKRKNTLVYYKKGSLECGTPDTTTLGINDHFMDNEMFSVFPNPAKSLITVVNKSQHSFQCKIISPLGQQVISVTLNPGSNQIDVSDLERGLYFVQMSDGIKVGVLKIIIE